jgi:hypothetical protein
VGTAFLVVGKKLYSSASSGRWTERAAGPHPRPVRSLSHRRALDARPSGFQKHRTSEPPVPANPKRRRSGRVGAGQGREDESGRVHFFLSEVTSIDRNGLFGVHRPGIVGAGRLPNAERFRGSRPSRIYAPTGALPRGRFGRGGSRPLRPKGSFEPGHAYLLPWAWRVVSLPQASAAKSRLTITCVARRVRVRR